jgi:hypothetical protein
MRILYGQLLWESKEPVKRKKTLIEEKNKQVKEIKSCKLEKKPDEEDLEGEIDPGLRQSRCPRCG